VSFVCDRGSEIYEKVKELTVGFFFSAVSFMKIIGFLGFSK
jgi:hypothetical protein